ncbi:Hypothethical protein, Adenine nucleotide alpha hydrolases-like [Paraburkholderia ribeironis]|uniref:Hypothethical protein, Adenine nucleotide alpha hydrolases-like n=1 Tax=Paraburkholderia ribeironis TaxID=1247936 RepID=A0A1N7SNT5_9BURK|nr:adenine nucleotide alpha hydrolase [Paraburkholderia ribeironis]SIT49037.1 Hypothethical protein, Adenine nucleotide alpha hydrolases-like [Paraburkholderia ribeironis]
MLGILNLSPEQRAELFDRTGMPLRRIGINVLNGAASAVDRCCRRCLLADDLPGVTVGPDGICNYCAEFEAESACGFYAPQRLLELVKTYRGNGSPDSVLAFSGGKDSALTLLLAVKELNLKPLAVLVDNGFIPDEVKENGRAFCGRHGVEMVVEKIDIRRVARESLQSTSGKIPCTARISGVFAIMARACRDRGLHLILGGHRFPPLAYPVSAFTKKEKDAKFVCVSPLLARRLSEAEQVTLIEEAGWRRVEIAGNTSNCKLIGLVEEHLYGSHGYNPHIFEVSKEVRVGFYSRADGYKKIDRPRINPEHRRWVEQRLGIDMPDKGETAVDKEITEL